MIHKAFSGTVKQYALTWSAVFNLLCTISRGVFTSVGEASELQINAAHISYQYAVNVVSVKVSCRRLQEPPVPAFVVGDVRLDLVVLPLVSN